MPGLQGPRVNLTHRSVTQRASRRGWLCSPACVQGLTEPSSRWLGMGENTLFSFWELVFLFINPGVCPPGQHLDLHLEGASSQLSASIPLDGEPSLKGSCPLGWETALGTVTTSQISQESVFFSSSLHFLKIMLFFQEYGFVLLDTAGYDSS